MIEELRQQASERERVKNENSHNKLLLYSLKRKKKEENHANIEEAWIRAET